MPDLKRGRGLAIGLGAVAVAWAVLAAVLERGAPAGIVLQGLVYGSIYALQAVGIVLVHRASRTVNFAQAELGTVAGVLAVSLVTQRDVPYLIAVPIGILIAALTGAVLHKVVLHRLRSAPRLIAAVATIAAGQVLAGAAALIALEFSGGPSAGAFTTPLSTEFVIAPVTFRGDHVLAVVTVLAVLGFMVAFLRSSAHGVAIRAAADNADRAAIVGIPVGRLTTWVWAAAGALSALAVLLRLPIDGFTTFSAVSSGGPAILVRTLAAAVIARLERPGVAVAAALGIGVTESLTSWTTGDARDVDLLLVAVILGALLLQRGGFSRREESDLATSRFRALQEVRPIPPELAQLPEVRYGAPAFRLTLLAFALTLPLWIEPSRLQLAAVVVIYAIVGCSVVLLTGWAGQISLGHWALVGLGGTTAATLFARHDWDFFLALPAGVLVSAGAALVIGLPALRARGPFLAVSTLALAVAASSSLFDERTAPWLVTDRMPRPTLWGRLHLDQEWQIYLLCVFALVTVMSALTALRRSRVGRVLIALRDNQPGAEAFGINPTSMRLLAFVLSGAVAGLAGVLYVTYQAGFRADAFNPTVSLQVFSLAVIGGLGSLGGAVLGAVYLRGAEFFLPSGWAVVASGAGVLVLLLVAPGGLGGIVDAVRVRILRSIAARRGIEVPSLTADRDDPDALQHAVAPLQALSSVTDGRPLALELRGINAGYDRVQVLFDLHLTVAEGEMVALLGTNGAGKSTALKVAAGLLRASAGSVTLLGDDRSRCGPSGLAAAGVGIVPGGRGVFTSLTVAENLRMARWIERGTRSPNEDALAEVLEQFPRLVQRWHTAAGDLSGGEQQQLSLAMALATQPKMLLIDELSLGLAPAVVEGLLTLVRETNRRGVTVVLVEQSVSNALKIADRAVFMEKGQARYDGDTAALLERPDVLRAVFLSTSPAKPKRTKRAADAAPVRLVGGGLCRSHGGVRAVDAVDIELRDREVLGIIGPNGAGKTTLLDLLSGFQRPDAGSLALDGADLTSMSPAERARVGVGRTFQDARLWPSLTVREVLAVATDRHVADRGIAGPLLGLPRTRASESEVDDVVAHLVEVFNLGAYAGKFVGELSTGSRRIVELACLLAHRPTVVLLDEPAGGLAQRETEALVPVLHRVRDDLGAGLIVIEHDLPMITAVSDRLIAMVEGRVVANGLPEAVLRDPWVEAAYLGASTRLQTG